MSRPECVREDVLLGEMTTLGVGGPARYLASCGSVTELRRVLQWSRQEQKPVFILGGGSNILVADSGFDGIVVKLTNSAIEYRLRGDNVSVRAGAGVDWDVFVEKSVAHGLAGIECLSGIPGLVGAAPIQNIGAYGQEVATTILSVTGVDMETFSKTRVPVADCGFGYRTSVFKTTWKSFVVTGVEFGLQKRDTGLAAYPDVKSRLGIDKPGAAAPTLAETRSAVLTIRSEKSMVISAEDPNRRSAGSFFLNPVLSRDDYESLCNTVRRKGIAGEVPSFPLDNDAVKLSAAWLIEHAGYQRGTSDGAVGLSTKHALAIVNNGGATADDIVRFAEKIRVAVNKEFGIELRPEPVFVGF